MSLDRSALEAQRARSAADYADRLGFDRDFLGVRVELPTPRGAAADTLATLAGSAGTGTGTELRYDHFSVLMNRTRRLACVAAGNLRTDAPFNAPRRDPWGYDPRLPESFQAGDAFYSENDLDRGHLFRRADGGWGADMAEARRASDDTFHWTNIAPQHFVFNQSDRNPDLSLWGLLEDQVMAEATRDRQRLDVFNGPIFGDDDPVHRGLAVPRAYWKVVSVVDRGRALRAFAFVVGQEALLRDLPPEAPGEPRGRDFDPGRFALYQVTLRDLGTRTGLDFGALRSADVMEARGAAERARGAGPAIVRISRLSDIVRPRR